MAQNYVDILVRSRDQGAKPEMDDLRVKLNDLNGRVAEARALVEDEAGAAKLDELQAKLTRLDRTTARPKITMDQAIRAESQVHSLEAAFQAFQQTADDAAKKGGKDLDDLDKKAKAAAKDSGEGLSKMLIAGFTVAASTGPGLLLAGTGAAVIAAGALVTKGNEQLVDSYDDLANRAADAITKASAPLVPALQASVDVLDQGIAKAEPQLEKMFSAAAPEATELAIGLSNLANNALPGMVAGLRAAAPYGAELADDLGELGTGVSDFVTGLSTGAKGGAEGLSALVDLASHLLGDLGQVTGALSQGLGPALHDIDVAAVPVASVLTDVVEAIPANTVRTAADAVAVLFAVFKGASLVGLIQEGTTFTQWLGLTKTKSAETAAAVTALGDAEAATAAKTGLMAAATDAALGPIGLFAGALTLAGAQSTFATHNIQNLIGKVSDVVNSQKQAAQAAKDHAAAAAQQSIIVTKAAQAQAGFTTAIKAAAGAAGDSADKSATATLAALELTNGTDQLTTGLYRTLLAYNSATTGAQGYNTALQALNGTQASLDDAQNTMAQDLLNLKSSFKANKDSMDLNTQAGINNRQALSAAAQSAVKLATSQYEANGNMGQANRTLQQQEQAIIKATGATGKARDAVKAYLDQIMHIPTNVTTNVHANTSPALSSLNGLIQRIDKSSGTVQIYATANNPSGGRALGEAHGGIIGGIGAAATGGPRGSWTQINEQGIEAVKLPFGAHVLPHADTMRILNQQSVASAVAVQLELVASDDLFLRWLRHAIRTRGGNVQKVLGQN